MSNITSTVLSDGTQVYRLDGEFHREDGPARIFSNGTEHWFIHGKCHREDGPAIVIPNGTKMWKLNDEYHREDGPATINPYGENTWYVNGVKHRIDGPSSVEFDIDAVIFTWHLEGKRYYDLSEWLNDSPITDEQKAQILSNYEFLNEGDEYSDRYIIEDIEFDYWVSEVYLELSSSELDNLKEHYRLMMEDE